MKTSELINKLADLQVVNGDQDVVIDTGAELYEVDDVDMGASDEGIVVWVGNLVDYLEVFMLNWIPATTAPKDGTVIIGSFHDTHPDRLVCRWCELNQEWVVAYPQVDFCEGKEGRFFENMHFHADDLLVWAEL